jgi:predicted small metal-binding protein
MKEFACGDVVPDCRAKFRAESDDELLKQVAAHARDDHGIAEVSTELRSAVLKHIRVSASG